MPSWQTMQHGIETSRQPDSYAHSTIVVELHTLWTQAAKTRTGKATKIVGPIAAQHTRMDKAKRKHESAAAAVASAP
jgi:hypothetical protein